jgi:hypothetical protein
MPYKSREKRAEYYQKNKEKIAEKSKEYREKNKEQRNAYKREYYKENKEKIAKEQKEYREKNKEQIAEKSREWYQLNKERVIEKSKEYSKEYNKTPPRKKYYTISNWKKKSIKCDDFDMLYDNYLKSTNCEECGILYGKKGDGTGTFKCCDHDHETGLFRNFLCNSCNLKRG